MSEPVPAVVVPCCDEQDVLPETGRRLDALLQRLIDAGEIDGGIQSQDIHGDQATPMNRSGASGSP